MKIFFTPYFKNNPYQKSIIDELSKIDVEVGVAGTGVNTFFNTSNLNKADVIHFHWFEPFIKSKSLFKSFVKMIYFLIRVFLLKKNKKYVWTVHNLVNHEKQHVFVDKFFLFFFIKMIDFYCVHNNYSKELLIKKYNIEGSKIRIIPHGNYENEYDVFTKDVFSFKREIMGVNPEKVTFTFLGNIRPYKGVLNLIKAFKKANTNNKSQLLICGRVSFEDDLEVIKKEIYGVENIIFRPGFIEDENIQGFIECSDVMVYPYKDILTSGALILGMSMKKTCIASKVGSMSEFLSKDFLFESIEDLSNLINKIQHLSLDEFRNIGEKNYTKIKGDTWENMAKKIKEIYVNE